MPVPIAGPGISLCAQGSYHPGEYGAPGRSDIRARGFCFLTAIVSTDPNGQPCFIQILWFGRL